MTRILAAPLAALAWCASGAAADGMPTRKPGLWQVAMELPGRAGATMKSQHCVGEGTEETAQRRALDEAADARCEQHNVKRGPGLFEADYRCVSARGKTEGHLRLAGDMTSRYTMENQMRFDPPRGGRSEGRMTQHGQWVGACPADMKPGEVRMSGLPTGGAPRGERAGRERQPPSPEQMQKMQEMLEQMKQQRGSR